MTNIFVANLSYTATEGDLHAAFSQSGNVEGVKIPADRDTGQSRGFAFVEMTSAGDAQNAITQVNGTQLYGRALNANEARPNPPAEQGVEEADSYGNVVARSSR